MARRALLRDPDAEVHQIMSVSNASLDVYPENSLTKFTHRLPARISIRPGMIASVALNTLVLDCYPKRSQSKLGYVKLHLQELYPTASPESSDSLVLARLPYKRKKVTYQRELLPVFQRLTGGGELRELNFLITDENNQQLQLKTGAPTVIQIEMIISRRPAPFSITLDYTMSRMLYLDNTLTTWQAEMPESFNISSEWEVALHSIQVPRALYLESTEMEISLRTREEYVQGKDPEQVNVKTIDPNHHEKKNRMAILDVPLWGIFSRSRTLHGV